MNNEEKTLITRKAPHLTRIAVDLKPFRGRVELWFLDESQNRPLVITGYELSVDPGGELEPVPLMMDLSVAQELIDGLWRCGLRPSEGSGSAGAMLKAEQHIDTLKAEIQYLRQIVDKLMGGGK